MSSSCPLLAAALIVRDESAHLPACLASLAGLVDEIVVYDTGSTDGSVAVAQAGGARVAKGFWNDDFGRARNSALAMARATWVLSVDADERLVADRALLRSMLTRARQTDVFMVRIRNVRETDSYDHPGPRLLRRESVSWSGALHEHPVRRDGRAVRAEDLPAGAARLDHLGYADAVARDAKARRNLAIAQAQVDALASRPNPDLAAVLSALLNLGRSAGAAGQAQRAVDAFETVRELGTGTDAWVWATDALAQALIGSGHDDAVFVLADDLRRGGVDPTYCDWLVAQALLQLDRPAEALALLRGIDRLTDSMGRVLDAGALPDARALAASRVGELEEATACLIQAMALHGRIRGRGPALLGLWGTRPPSALARLLVEIADPQALPELVAELVRCPDPGPGVAELLGALTPATIA
jgi:tetratricopeptide (TPR) repeat protein